MEKHITNEVLMEIAQERQRQKDLAHGGDTEAFDKANSRNDWVSYITAYAGRAADKCPRNERDKCDFRDVMKKVAALAVAAIESHDKGFMTESEGDRCLACKCSIHNSKEMCGMCWGCYSKRERNEE